MKKLIAAIFALTALTVMASSSRAAFTSVAKQSVTAVATMGGVAKVTVDSLEIKDVVDVNGPNRAQLTWTGIDPTALGANPWRVSDQLIKLRTTITTLTGGIQLITDNTNGSATPKFVDPTPAISSNTDSNPAGLLLVPAIGNNTSDSLSMAWSIKDSSRTVESNLGDDTRGIGATDPNTGAATGGNNKFQWLFVVDKQSKGIDWNGSGFLGDTIGGIADTSDFIDGQEFSRIMDDRGIHYAQANADGSPAFGGGPGTKTSFVYFQADFTKALPTLTYKTNTLTLETFTE